MIDKIIIFLESLEIHNFAILDEKFNVLYRTATVTEKLENILTGISPPSYFFSHYEQPDGSHAVLIKITTNLLLVLLFPTYDNAETIIPKVIYEIFSTNTTSFINQDLSTKNADLENKPYYDQKRQLELYFAHAIRSCNYAQVDALIPKLYSYFFQGKERQDSQFIQRSIISLVAILTRMIIRENVDPKLAYNLSDKYLKSDFSLQKKNYLDLIKKITYDFMLLLENQHYKLNFPVVDEAIIYIKRNIYSEVFVSDVADELGVSVQYLSSIFKKITGKNIKYFIQNEKIKEAEFLLVNTDLSIHKISVDLGYSNQSHFTKVFKELSGMTPSSFRKNNIY